MLADAAIEIPSRCEDEKLCSRGPEFFWVSSFFGKQSYDNAPEVGYDGKRHLP